VYSTAYVFWTFTWFVHFELPYRLKGTEKIHTERFSKFPSNIYSILYRYPTELVVRKRGENISSFFHRKNEYFWEHNLQNLTLFYIENRGYLLLIDKYLNCTVVDPASHCTNVESTPGFAETKMFLIFNFELVLTKKIYKLENKNLESW